MDYNNIILLAKKYNYKKLMLMKKSWGKGSWCIVNKIIIKPNEKYGYAIGHINYSNGNKVNGNIDGAGTYSWRVIKVFDENMEVEKLKNENDENVQDILL